MNENSPIFYFKDISIPVGGNTPLKVSLKINKGDYVIIKGRNSSGKSMLLKLFYLKVLPKKGQIFLREMN